VNFTKDTGQFAAAPGQQIWLFMPLAAPKRHICRNLDRFLSFPLTGCSDLLLKLHRSVRRQEQSVFPEFVPDKVMWAMAVLATVAVMVSRAHADVPMQPAHGFHSICHVASFKAGESAP
jgi:hypothetical protein